MFVGDLARTKARYPFALFGYCLMSNHFHLLLKPAPGQVDQPHPPVLDRRPHLAAPPETGNQRPRLAGPLPISGHPGRRPPARRSEVHRGQPGAGRDGGRSMRVYLVEPPLPWRRACRSHPGLVPGMGASSVALSRNVGPAGDGRSVGNNRPRSWMACGRRSAVAGPTVQRTGSRSFPIASASSVSRAVVVVVVVVRLAKRCSDTGILPDTGILRSAERRGRETLPEPAQ